MPVVEIPEKEVEVEFPDTMSRNDIEREIYKKWPELATSPRQQKRSALLLAQEGKPVTALSREDEEGSMMEPMAPTVTVPKEWGQNQKRAELSQERAAVPSGDGGIIMADIGERIVYNLSQIPAAVIKAPSLLVALPYEIDRALGLVPKDSPNPASVPVASPEQARSAMFGSSRHPGTVGEGAKQFASELASSFTSPEMAGAVVAPIIASPFPRAAGAVAKATGTAFASDMISHLPEQIQNYLHEKENGDLESQTKAALNVAASVGFPVAIAKGMAKTPPPVGPVNGKANFLAGLERAGAPLTARALAKSMEQKPSLPPEAKIAVADIPPVRAEDFIEPNKPREGPVLEAEPESMKKVIGAEEFVEPKEEPKAPPVAKQSLTTETPGEVRGEVKPIQAYHFTTEPPFEKFDPSRIGSSAGHSDPVAGFYLTNNPKYKGNIPEGQEVDFKRYDATVNLRNPLRLKTYDDVDVWGTDGETARRNIEKAGYDGVIFAGGDEIVAFRPEQVSFKVQGGVKAEAKPVTPEKPASGPSPFAEPPSDLIDDIAGHVGKRIRLSSLRQYREKIKMSDLPNSVKKLMTDGKGGIGVDEALDGLHRQQKRLNIETVDDFVDALLGAAAARGKAVKAGAKEKRQLASDEKQQVEPVDPKTLKVGDKFKLQGEPFEVTEIEIDPATGEFVSARVSDGRKFGVKELTAEAEFAPDQGVVTSDAGPAMGAQTPGEAEAGFSSIMGKIEKGKTAIKNAQVEKDRATMGLPPFEKAAREDYPGVWEQAMAEIDRDPAIQDKLIADLKAKPRALANQLESALLHHRLVDLKNEYARTARDIAQAVDDGRLDQIPTLQTDLTFWSDKVLELTDITKASGREWGRTGVARRQLAADDFTLLGLEMQKRADRGGAPITDTERAELKKIADDYKAKSDALEKLNADFEEKLAKSEAARVMAEAIAEVAKKTRYAPQVLAQAEKFAGYMDGKAAEALKRINARLGRTSAGVVNLDVGVLFDVAIIGAAKMTRGLVDFSVHFSEWSKSMVDDVGDWIKPHLDEVWDASKENFENELAKNEKKLGKPVADKVKRVVKKLDVTEQIDATRDKIEALVEKGENQNLHTLAYKLGRLIIERDKLTGKDFEKLYDALHPMLKEFIPDMTRSEARDAFSGIGIYTLPKADAVSVATADLRRQSLLRGQTERIETGKPVPPTGPQRGPMSDEARGDLQRKEEAKRRYGMVASSERQLQSALQSREKWYTNRLSDLRAEIKTGERIVKSRSPSPTGPKLEALKTEYEQVKAEHAEIFPRKDLTDTQKIDLAVKAADRHEAAWNTRLVEARKGNFDVVKAPGRKVTSAELEAIKARTETAKATVEELKNADVAYQESVQLKSFEDAAAEYERKSAAGEFGREPATVKATSPAIEAAKAKRDVARDRLADLRAASPEAKRAALEKANKAVDASLLELERQINVGDIAAKAKGTPSVTSPELELKRAERDQLLKIKAQLRNALKPKKTPQEIALQSAKTRMLNEIAKKKEQIAAGDFERKVKPPLKLDPPGLSIKADLEQIRVDWQRARLEDLKARRTRGQKVWGAIKQIPMAFVNILSSFDFSAPRQALPFLLSAPSRFAMRPIRSVKIYGMPFARMFSAAFSEHQAKVIEQRRLHRNGPMTAEIDKISGVEFTDLDATNFTKWEDAAHSVLDEWAALPFKTGNLAKTVATAPVKAGANVVRGSNRAFITFLNEARAGLLDELLRINFKKRAPSDVEVRDVGNVVNLATGRGNLSPMTAKVGATILWSPNLFASRMKSLAGQPFWHPGSLLTKRIVAEEYARVIAGGFLLSYVSGFFDEKKEESKVSTDFGKIVRGNTRIDLWGGYQQQVVIFNRAMTGTSITLKGKTEDIGFKKKFGVKGIWHYMVDFGRSKLRPDIGLAVNAITRTDFIGQNTDPTTTEGLKRLGKSMVPIPLSLQDIVAVMKEHGFTEAMIIQALSAFGAGVSHYGEREKQK